MRTQEGVHSMKTTDEHRTSGIMSNPANLQTFRIINLERKELPVNRHTRTTNKNHKKE